MLRTKRQAHVETVAIEPIEQTPTKTKAKKPKLTDEEYADVLALRVASYKSKPVRISKYYYTKAMVKLRRRGSKKKQKHPMIERSSVAGTKALNLCHSYSIDSLNRRLVQPVVYAPSWSLLVKMLRKALLSRNWSYCLRLYNALLKHGSLRRKQLLYLIRLTFLLMLNMNVSSKRLNDFLTVTLAMRKIEDQKAFLWSLIELKKIPNVKPKTIRKDDNSNVEDDPDNVEDDPDNVEDDLNNVKDDPDNVEAISCDSDATSENSDSSDSA